MTIQNFFDTFEGLWIETNKGTDPSTYDQCVDAWRAYNRKVIKAPDMFGNAVDFWTNYPTDYYDRIPRQGNEPRLGDVIIWGTNYCRYGHIAVCTEIVSATGFTSFDQNDPLKSPCHYQPHTFGSVLGWLRPKNLNQSLPDEELALEVLKSIPRENSLEGLARQLAGEHEHFITLENKARQLDGFIAKWISELQLDSSSGLVQIEVEMSKLLPLEDRVNKLRGAIEDVVGLFDNDSALLASLHAVKSDKEKLSSDLADCQLKLSGTKVLYAFNLGKFTVKILKRR